jgi:hypothetical protein
MSIKASCTPSRPWGYGKLHRICRWGSKLLLVLSGEYGEVVQGAFSSMGLITIIALRSTHRKEGYFDPCGWVPGQGGRGCRVRGSLVPIALDEDAPKADPLESFEVSWFFYLMHLRSITNWYFSIPSITIIKVRVGLYHITSNCSLHPFVA